tara:strand:- start:2847 stop:3125 length:279 start_codon:yes stop_codon:yes gene_type:complete
MNFDIVEFYNEKLQDLGKEKIGFPNKYFELSYDQRMFITDLCEGIWVAKQKTEDLDDAMASLKEHREDLKGLVAEFESTIETVRASLDQLKK